MTVAHVRAILADQQVWGVPLRGLAGWLVDSAPSVPRLMAGRNTTINVSIGARAVKSAAAVAGAVRASASGAQPESCDSVLLGRLRTACGGRWSREQRHRSRRIGSALAFGFSKSPPGIDFQ